MRRKSTFLLTILPAETSDDELHGSLRTVTDGSLSTFSNLEELFELIHAAVKAQDETVGKRQSLRQSTSSQAS